MECKVQKSETDHCIDLTNKRFVKKKTCEGSVYLNRDDLIRYLESCNDTMPEGSVKRFISKLVERLQC